jgi:hypothetical protein
MKPVDPPEYLCVWIVASISATGTMTTHSPSSPGSTLWPGYYLSVEDAQQEQMLLALKGTKSHVFQLDFPRP